MEVGESESISRLRVDARIWLDTSDGQTRHILFLSIDKVDKKLLFEIWERIQNPNAMTIRSNWLLIQRVTIDYTNENTVTNAPLLFPITLIR